MKIGFTGTQHGMTMWQHKTLQLLLSHEQFDEAHHGDCIGADDEFDSIVRAQNKSIIIHPSANNSRRAFCHLKGESTVLEAFDYLVRDRHIVDAVDKMYATPFEEDEVLRSGTWATIRWAKKKNKPLVIIYPHGLCTHFGIV